MEPRTKEIDGVEYSVNPFAGEQSFKLFVRLRKATDGNFTDMESGELMAVHLATRLDDTNGWDLVKALLVNAKRHYPTDEAVEVMKLFALEFASDMPRLFKLLAFVVEVNWGNFWQRGAGGFDRQMVLASLEKMRTDLLAQMSAAPSLPDSIQS
jgi:hypothetical protein